VLTCRQVSHLVSEEQDRRLGWLERWRLRVHLKVCEGCRHFQANVDFMRKAVRHDGVKARVAEKDFEVALGRRIFPEDGVDLFAEVAEHGRPSAPRRGRH